MALTKLFIQILITDLLVDSLTQKKIGNVFFFLHVGSNLTLEKAAKACKT